MQPKISVVIPVYNVEAYLRECLDSVVNQTLRDIQIICVNDGSTDDSLAILREYADRDSRIEIIDKPNGGLSSARNAAFSSVRGKYIMFVDSDDWIDPTACEKTYYYTEQACAEFTLFQFCFYFPKTETLAPDRLNSSLLVTTPEQKKQLLKTASHVSACTKLWRTDFLFRHELKFPEGLNSEDLYFFWRAVVRAERIAFLPQFLYFYRRHGTSITASRGEKRLDALEICALIEKDLRLTGNDSPYREEFIV